MTKPRYLKIPVMVIDGDEMKERIASMRKRSKRKLNARALGKPVLKAKARRKGGVGLPSPLRRGRIVCRVLGPEEWGLVFPDIPSDYGGIYCSRRK